MDKYQKLISAINRSVYSKEKKEELISLVKIKKRIDRECIKALYDEAWKMYDSFIDQFYNYKTTSYIRHEESRPGTQRGINLYRAQNFSLNQDSHNISFTIGFTDEDMEYEHYKDSAYDVLQNVLTGYRYKHTFEQSTFYMKWKGKYRGRYFHIENTTIIDAFNTFVKEYPSMWAKVLNEKWRRYY